MKIVLAVIAVLIGDYFVQGHPEGPSTPSCPEGMWLEAEGNLCVAKISRKLADTMYCKSLSKDAVVEQEGVCKLRLSEMRETRCFTCGNSGGGLPPPLPPLPGKR